MQPSKLWKRYIEVHIANPKILELGPDYCDIRFHMENKLYGKQ